MYQFHAEKQLYQLGTMHYKWKPYGQCGILHTGTLRLGLQLTITLM